MERTIEDPMKSLFLTELLGLNANVLDEFQRQLNDLLRVNLVVSSINTTKNRSVWRYVMKCQLHIEGLEGIEATMTVYHNAKINQIGLTVMDVSDPDVLTEVGRWDLGDKTVEEAREIFKKAFNESKIETLRKIQDAEALLQRLRHHTRLERQEPQIEATLKDIDNTVEQLFHLYERRNP